MQFRPLLVAILSLGLAAPAIADQRCRSVDVRFQNDTSRIIRVLSFEYYDEEDRRWRSENVRNTVIGIGAISAARDETLEYVGNEPLNRFRVWHRTCAVASGGTCTTWSNGRQLSADVNGIPGISRCTRNIDLTIPVEAF